MAEKQEVVTLSRKPVEVSNLKSLSEENVMEEVHQLLGYKVGLQVAELQKVSAIFKELDIEPFDQRKVEAYKKQRS